jgi:hypothetical protein
MHRLEAVTHVRQSAAHDYAHRVIEIGAPHLLFEADRQRLASDLFHLGGSRAEGPRVKPIEFTMRNIRLRRHARPPHLAEVWQ